MERLALQRMLFPNNSKTPPAAGGPWSSSRASPHSHTWLNHTKSEDEAENERVQRAARQWHWLTGLSLGHHLAAGTWMVF